jgi:hypothetical protein
VLNGLVGDSPFEMFDAFAKDYPPHVATLYSMLPTPFP